MPVPVPAVRRRDLGNALDDTVGLRRTGVRVPRRTRLRGAGSAAAGTSRTTGRRGAPRASAGAPGGATGLRDVVHHRHAAGATRRSPGTQIPVARPAAASVALAGMGADAAVRGQRAADA